MIHYWNGISIINYNEIAVAFYHVLHDDHKGVEYDMKYFMELSFNYETVVIYVRTSITFVVHTSISFSGIFLHS